MKENKLIYLFLFIEGFLSISFEILGIRQLTTYIGNNIINTSFVIGFFLLFLAFGYLKGSNVRKNYLNILYNNFIKIYLIFTVGFSNLFLDFLYFNIKNYFIFLFLYSFFIIGTLTYYIGQTLPILSNFLTFETGGELNGKVLFLSTLGSFLGSLGISLMFINFFGITFTILFISLLLFLILILLALKLKKNLLIPFFILVLNTFFNYYAIKKYIIQNNYSSIEIKSSIDNKKKLLVINNNFSSGFNFETNKSIFKYVNIIDNIIKKYKNKNILVIGAGGFTIGLNDKNNKYTYVDIDKDLKFIAENYFLKRKINGKFIPEDIKLFFNKTNYKYDIIVIDAYSNLYTIPYYLLTLDFFKDIQKHLTKNGFLLLNVIMDTDFSSNYSRHLVQTLNKNFVCLSKPANGKLDDKKYSNVIFYCKSKKDKIIYTNDKINLIEIVNYNY